MRWFPLAFVLLLLVACGGERERLGFAASEAPGEKPNVVLVWTDDQPHHTLNRMPKTRSLLAAEGTTFSLARTTRTLCAARRGRRCSRARTPTTTG